MKLRELITAAVFLLGLSQIPALLAELLRIGLWIADLHESADLFVQDRSFLIMQVGSGVASFTKAAIIVSFVFLPNWWAGLVPRASNTVEIPALSLQSVQVTLVSLTGIVLVVLAISDLADYFVSWHTRRPFDDSAIDLTISHVTYLPLVVQAVVRLVLGAWMVLGAHGLVEIWHRFRTGEGISNAA